VAEQDQETEYWLVPVASSPDLTAHSVIQSLVSDRRVFAFRHGARGRKSLKAGDWICFYASKKGVVAHARIAVGPQEEIHNWLPHPERFPWVIRLEDVKVYLDYPLLLEEAVRVNLDAFRGRASQTNYGWFLQSSRRISKHDFESLTRKETPRETN
jgi:hypothetical protein